MDLNTSLEDLLKQEINCLLSFCSAIEQEQAALVSGAIDALPAAAEKKSAQAAQLSKLDSTRNALLTAHGYAAGRTGMDAWLESQASATESAASWAKVLELAAKAKTENEINGRLIGAQLQQNQQALKILIGDSGATMTYGPTGQQAGLVGRRPLGSA